MAKKKTKKQKSLMRRLIECLGGLILILIFIAVFAAVAGYHPQDPGANAAGVLPVRNYLGYPGAYLADCVLKSFGLALPVFLLAFRFGAIRCCGKKNFCIRTAGRRPGFWELIFLPHFWPCFLRGWALSKWADLWENF